MTDPLGGQMVVQREQLTPEQSAFVRAVDDFCARECPPHKLREITDNGTVTHHPGIYRKLAATGWLGLTIPEEYGGSGRPLSPMARCRPSRSRSRTPDRTRRPCALTPAATAKAG